MSKTYIITGASRGIGYYISRHLAGEGVNLFLIARSDMDEVAAELSDMGALVHTFTADLSDSAALEDLMSRIFSQIDQLDTESIALINNAGMLAPVGPIGKYDGDTFRQNLEVNFVAPVLLSHLFIQYVQAWNCTKRILNVSSGAAFKAYPGWGHYCSTKAGLNMFTSCIHEEQKTIVNPVQVVAYNPGRTDTQMQTEIREVEKDDFPNVQSFIDAYNQKALNNPDDVAREMVSLLKDANYPDGEIVSYGK